MQALTRYWQRGAVLLLALLLGLLLGADCENLWVSVLLLIGISLLIPLSIRLMGNLQSPWIQAISKVAFIVFMLFGGIVVITGGIGMFNNEQFLSSACSGANAATDLTLNLLRGVGRAL
jgi:predicted small integral membrane protein